MRNCEDCHWCCYFPEIPNSPVNEWCGHCNSGCDIYDDRPEVCKNFGCLWYNQEQVPESLRPDLCGVMFELPSHCKTYIGYVISEDNDIYKKPEVSILIQKITDTGHPVVIHHKEGNHLFLSEGMTEQDVTDDLNNAIKKMDKR